MVVPDYSTINVVEEEKTILSAKSAKTKIDLTLVRDINNIGKLYNVRTFKMPTGELEIFFSYASSSTLYPCLRACYN